jgi:hypothetical protein
VPREVRWPREAWIPLLAGLFWLWRAPGHGALGFLFSVVPGCLLLASGVTMLLMPGDRRIAQFAALGGVLGVLFALPAFFVQGPVAGLLLIAASIAGFVAAGVHGLLLEPAVEGVPPAVFSLRLGAEVALDEALLATMFLGAKLPRAGDHVRIPQELAEARARFEAEGWLEKPESYHLPPPALEAPRMDAARIRGCNYEHLRFESGYQPHAGEPGRERWLGYAANRTAHAWVLRHPGPPRPWLVCIHGYQMGWPTIDLLAFQHRVLHQRLGVNLLVPTLPLHGLRKQGRRSGDGFLSGDPLDTIHAEAQAMWDLRRLLSWLREDQAAPVIGAMGFSLGGYNTALLASLDDGLCCAIAGIPVTDFARIYYRHLPPLHLNCAAQHGLAESDLCAVLRVISPLALTPKVPRDGRWIFAGIADRLVPADQIHDLWLHWDKPKIAWYPGGHMTFRLHPGVGRLVLTALAESGLSRQAGSSPALSRGF